MITDHCLNSKYYVKKGNGVEVWAMILHEPARELFRVAINATLLEQTFRSLENAEAFLKANHFKERT